MANLKYWKSGGKWNIWASQIEIVKNFITKNKIEPLDSKSKMVYLVEPQRPMFDLGELKMIKKGLTACTLGLLLIIPPIVSQANSLSGVLSIIWGDNIDGKSTTVYSLTSDSGQRTVLQIDDTISKKVGGILRFNGKKVTVEGSLVQPSNVSNASGVNQIQPPVLQVDTITIITPLESRAPEIKGEPEAAAVSGSHPWITIMCKFSDIASEPHNLSYFQGMYSDTKPGLNHYWKEVSLNTFDITGSTVAGTGWYTLANTEQHYNPTDTSQGADKTALMTDCIAAADANVNFSLYDGINMMFNSDFDNGWAWGGGTGPITLDGVTKSWKITWEPPWGYANISVIAHETGHGFGLPHSTAIDWTSVYDNAWDVMSQDRYNCAAATDTTYGCMPQHAISYHKDLLGAIPSARQKTVGSGETDTVTLRDLAAPVSTNYQLVKIPIGASPTEFYTVEARRHTGYDTKLPGEAVIIHKVDMTKGAVLVPNTLGATDPGVMWTVGKTFNDATNKILVTVDSATSDGFKVTISNQGSNGKKYGSIWQYTGTPCSGNSCPGWQKFDNNAATMRIAAGGNKLYQLHNSGKIWSYTGTPCSGNSCPGWKMLDNNSATIGIATDGNQLYQLHNSGKIWSYTGTPCSGNSCPGWKMLDNNSATIAIAADGGQLYQLHNNGKIWRFTGTACSGNSCPGWQMLDNNGATVSIAAGGGKLYQLHDTGKIWRFTGMACNGNSCPGWQMLDNNPATIAIVAGSQLYQLHNTGKIWKSTGATCSDNSCPGWNMLDNNPATIGIYAEGNQLYQLHNTGKIWEFTGAACSDNSCPGWKMLDNNASTGRVAAGGGKVYQLHLARAPMTRTRICYECK
jgi:M6 family metalloprotease-like protein